MEAEYMDRVNTSHKFHSEPCDQIKEVHAPQGTGTRMLETFYSIIAKTWQEHKSPKRRMDQQMQYIRKTDYYTATEQVSSTDDMGDSSKSDVKQEKSTQRDKWMDSYKEKKHKWALKQSTVMPKVAYDIWRSHITQFSR